MPVMRIREMLVTVVQRFVQMRMRVPRTRRNVFRVLMLVVGFVLVPVVVDHGLVSVPMQVPLAKVQPSTRCHECAGCRELYRDCFTQ